MKQEDNQLAYTLAALAEQDLMFHGKKDEWYTLTLFLPGMTNLMHLPTQIIRKKLDELLISMPYAIKERQTSALARGWILLDIKIDKII